MIAARSTIRRSINQAAWYATAGALVCALVPGCYEANPPRPGTFEGRTADQWRSAAASENEGSRLLAVLALLNFEDQSIPEAAVDELRVVLEGLPQGDQRTQAEREWRRLRPGEAVPESVRSVIGERNAPHSIDDLMTSRPELAVTTTIADLKTKSALIWLRWRDDPLPDNAEGQRRFDQLWEDENTDLFGNVIQYKRIGTGILELRSAGPDRVLNTADDIRTTSSHPGPEAL